MNLDEYIVKFERGAFSFQELEKIAINQSISTIFRLYVSYGEAKKIGFYDDDSLRWILSYLERELKLAGFEKAASLLKIDINHSFSSFWTRFKELNQANLIERSDNIKLISSVNIPSEHYKILKKLLNRQY